MERERAEIVGLTEIAKSVLELDAAIDPDDLVAQLTNYLDQFELWQKGFEEREVVAEAALLDDAAKEEFKSRIDELLQVHIRIVERAEQAKAAVGEEMSNIHRRGSAMKKYVDRYPSRISIAGKRKG